MSDASEPVQMAMDPSTVVRQLEAIRTLGPGPLLGYAQLCDVAALGEAGWYSERELCDRLPCRRGTFRTTLVELAAAGVIRRRYNARARRQEYELPRLARTPRGRFARHHFAHCALELMAALVTR